MREEKAPGLRGKRAPTWLYVGGIVAVALGFVGTLWEGVQGAVPETDLWWMIPVLSYYLSQTPLAGLPAFLISPTPRYFEAPILKSYLWGMGEFLHLPFRCMIFGMIALHFVNAALVAWVGRLLGLSRRASLLAGFVYLTLFIHSQAFLWVPAFQHLFSVTTLLAVMGLFLKSEERLAQGRNAGGWYFCACGAALLASLQNAAMIGLALVGCHILFCAPNGGVAMARYRRWLPLWAACMIYPILSISFLGLDVLLKAVAMVPLSPWVKAAGLALIGSSALLGMGALIPVLYGSARQRRSARLALMGGAAFLWVGLMLRDKRQILFAYNALIPLSTLLGSFWDPFRTAMGMPSVESYHYVPPYVSGFSLISVVLLAAAFFRLFVRKQKALALLFVWYGLCLIYLLLHHHAASSMPIQLPARYFIYLTPIFSMIVAALACEAANRWRQSGSGKKRGMRTGVLWGFLLLLGVPNLLAIRVAMFRGRLTNSYLIYDDLRLARLVRDDWARSGREASTKPVDLYIQNVVPTLFPKIKWSRPVDYTRIGHENFRMLLREELRGLSIERVHLNEQPPAGSQAKTYRVEAGRILDERGRSIEPFSQMLGEANARMREGNEQDALDLYKKAVLERPFLLNYVLARHLRLADLFWVTGGRDFRDFFAYIRGRNQIWGVAPVEKAQRTSDVIQKELSNYALCLFCVASLEYQAGHLQESRFWLSQVGFLENDPEILAGWLEQIPEIRSSAALQGFLEKIRDPFFFREPLIGKKEDYAFGRFLVRLLLHRDIRSKWDNRFEILP